MLKRFPFMKEMTLAEEVHSMHRLYQWLPFPGNVFLSVQASEDHACLPQRNITPFEYTHFEIAFFKREEFVPIEEVLLDAKLCDKLAAYHRPVHQTYHHVPSKLIEQISKALVKQAKGRAS